MEASYVFTALQGQIDAATPGLFNHYVVYPFSYVIQHLADWLAGDYGLAIIALTLAVRLLMLPLMLRQYRNQSAMKRRMDAVKPELQRLQDQYKGKENDAAAKQALQRETMQLYQQHGINPLSAGCLPALIQLPILSGLYYAINRTPEIASHSFLWFQLGQPDIVLPLIVAAVYFALARINRSGAGSGAAGEQAKPLALLGYLSPILMAAFAFAAPAVVPLYWAVGGAFMLLQTVLAKRMYPPQTAAQA